MPPPSRLSPRNKGFEVYITFAYSAERCYNGTVLERQILTEVSKMCNMNMLWQLLCRLCGFCC